MAKKICQCTTNPCTCAENFWITATGVNTLKGCTCDPDNPIVLQLDMILHILATNTKAREEFWKLYPSLFPCEKEKFDNMFKENPWLKVHYYGNPQDINDNFQSKMNATPIYQVILNAPPKKVPGAPPFTWPKCP